MIDFKKIVSASESMNEDWLLKQISPSSIFFLYHGPFKIGKVYNSVFRKEHNPSCGFFIHPRTGALLYNDFASGMKLNCIQFVMKLFSLGYYDAIKKIARDFGLIDGGTNITTSLKKELEDFETTLKKEEVLIQWEAKPFTRRDLEYWTQYEITEEDLKREHIYSVKSLFLNKKEIKNYNDELRFAYPLKIGEDDIRVKIYSPYSVNLKWLSSIPNNKPFGLKTLPFKSETVYITKSRKDELVLKKIFTDVISLQNESEQSLSDEVDYELIQNYNRRVIVFDADPPGVKASTKLNNKGYLYFNTPNKDYCKYNITDPSDYVKVYGLDLLKQEFAIKGFLN